MKAMMMRVVVLWALVVAGPAAAQVQLQETVLPAAVFSTVLNIQSQCWYCQGLEVHTFNVMSPTSGPINPTQAAWAAIEWLGAWQYEVSTPISQSTFNGRMANFNYEELPPVIRSSVAPGDTAWTASESWWGYMTAPDYCDYGHFYVLVFPQARKVVTVEVLSGHEC